MNYDTARHFADSWGLLFTVILFLVSSAGHSAKGQAATTNTRPT